MTYDSQDELLSAYIDGELTGDEQAHVEKLLAESAEFRQLHDELCAMRTSLKALFRHQLPEDLSHRILRRAERAMLSGAADDSALHNAAASDAARSNAPASHVVTPSSVELSNTSSAGISRLTSWRRWAWPVLAVAAALLVMVFFPPRERDEVKLAEGPKRPLPESAISAAPQAGQPKKALEELTEFSDDAEGMQSSDRFGFSDPSNIQDENRERFLHRNPAPRPDDGLGRLSADQATDFSANAPSDGDAGALPELQRNRGPERELLKRSSEDRAPSTRAIRPEKSVVGQKQRDEESLRYRRESLEAGRKAGASGAVARQASPKDSRFKGGGAGLGEPAGAAFGGARPRPDGLAVEGQGRGGDGLGKVASPQKPLREKEEVPAQSAGAAEYLSLQDANIQQQTVEARKLANWFVQAESLPAGVTPDQVLVVQCDVTREALEAGTFAKLLSKADITWTDSTTEESNGPEAAGAVAAKLRTDVKDIAASAADDQAAESEEAAPVKHQLKSTERKQGQEKAKLAEKPQLGDLHADSDVKLQPSASQKDLERFTKQLAIDERDVNLNFASYGFSDAVYVEASSEQVQATLEQLQSEPGFQVRAGATAAGFGDATSGELGSQYFDTAKKEFKESTFGRGLEAGVSGKVDPKKDELEKTATSTGLGSKTEASKPQPKKAGANKGLASRTETKDRPGPSGGFAANGSDVGRGRPSKTPKFVGQSKAGAQLGLHSATVDKSGKTPADNTGELAQSTNRGFARRLSLTDHYFFGGRQLSEGLDAAAKAAAVEEHVAPDAPESAPKAAAQAKVTVDQKAPKDAAKPAAAKRFAVPPRPDAKLSLPEGKKPPAYAPPPPSAPKPTDDTDHDIAATPAAPAAAPAPSSSAQNTSPAKTQANGPPQPTRLARPGETGLGAASSGGRGSTVNEPVVAGEPASPTSGPAKVPVLFFFRVVDSPVVGLPAVESPAEPAAKPKP